MRRTLLLLLVFLAVLLAFHQKIIGALLDPVLEKKLTSLFGMRVEMHDLKVNPFTGRVRGKGLEFLNQPGFSYGPHLWSEKVEFFIDLPALLEKRVDIGRVTLYKVYFFIERRAFENETRSNIKTWIRHIKNRRHEPGGEGGKTEWSVSIQKIIVREGTFVYDDRSRQDAENRFVFHRLKGELRGFRWPSDAPENLDQELTVQGLIGTVNPAPFSVRGHANFATSQVSFDLLGRIQGGDALEYERFWQTVPVEVKHGRFDVEIRMICLRQTVRSRSRLRIYDLNLGPGKSVDIFLGVPVAAALGFLQSQKEIELKVPVSGSIKDPQFDFYKAFAVAFQEALGKRVRGSVRIIAQGPQILVSQTEKLAGQTGELVTRTGETITQGLEKITGMVVKKEGT